MHFLFSFLIFISLHKANAFVHIEDNNKLLTPQEISQLEGSIKNARNYFNDFITNNEIIRVKINPESCLRTSYNYKKHELHFCKRENTISMGTKSIDIINHEVFHYLYCGAVPENCTPTKMKDINVQSIHEGLADLFSYSMNKDPFFGENFRIDIPYLRSYQNDLCYKYLTSAHQRGNALTSFLIKNKYHFDSLKEFLYNFDLLSLSDDNCFNSKQSTILQPLNRKLSVRNKYWIKKKGSITFKIMLDSKIHLSINSSLKHFHYSIIDNHIVFDSKGSKGFDKILFNLVRDNKIIGETRLYLGAR